MRLLWIGCETTSLSFDLGPSSLLLQCSQHRFVLPLFLLLEVDPSLIFSQLLFQLSVVQGDYNGRDLRDFPPSEEIKAPLLEPSLFACL